MKNENIETNKNSSKNTAKPNETKDNTSKDDHTSPVQSLLIAIQESGAELFHDQYTDTYIAYYGDGSSVSKITSKITKM